MSDLTDLLKGIPAHRELSKRATIVFDDSDRFVVKPRGWDADLVKAAPYIGPKGGKWNDPAHKIPYNDKKHEVDATSQHTYKDDSEILIHDPHEPGGTAFHTYHGKGKGGVARRKHALEQHKAKHGIERDIKHTNFDRKAESHARKESEKKRSGGAAKGKHHVHTRGGKFKEVKTLHRAGHYAVHQATKKRKPIPAQGRGRSWVPEQKRPASFAVTHAPTGLAVGFHSKEKAVALANHMHEHAGDAGGSTKFGKQPSKKDGALLEDAFNKFHKAMGTDHDLEKAGGPFIGKRGGKWADAKHTISWKEGKTGAHSTFTASRHHQQKPALAPAKEKGDNPLEAYNQEVIGKDKKQAALIAKKMAAGISKAADVCKMSPPVCKDNMNIPRSEMPQLLDESFDKLRAKGDGWKVDAAIKAGADPNMKGSLFDSFLDTLKAKGISIEHGKINVGQLKATQREIKAAKTFGMADAHLKGKYDPGKAPIVISKDNYILDGHHRYAAMLTIAPDRKMNIIRVDAPMKDILKDSFKQPGVFRANMQDEVVPGGTPDRFKKSMDTDHLEKAGGPFIGKRGGKWADAKHTIPWKPSESGTHPNAPSGFEPISGDPHGTHYKTSGRTKVWLPHDADPAGAEAHHGEAAMALEQKHRSSMTRSGYPKDKEARAQLKSHWETHYALKEGNFKMERPPKKPKKKAMDTDHDLVKGKGEGSRGGKILKAIVAYDKAVEKATLTTEGRKRIKESNFALSGRRYPIQDATHARNALARVAQHGTPEEIRQVKRAVKRKYPAIDVGGENE